MIYIDVILPLAISDAYTYSVEDDAEKVVVGMRVIVPLVRKEVVGIVCHIHTEDDLTFDFKQKIRPIITCLDSMPAVTSAQLQLWQWVSEYYMCPIGDVLAAALPNKLLDKTYSIDDGQKRRVKIASYTGDMKSPNTLTEQQIRAATEIKSEWKDKRVVLLEGVTSSGKTEVYIHIIEEQLAQGKQVLYLVPEIALTTQLTERLQCVFGNRLLVYHSRVSPAQRAEVYRHILTRGNQEGQLIVGARSAVFMPLSDLGLIIVDEEHDGSYKQQEPAPRYNARSVAIMMATQMNARVLLGTATPAIETQYNAQKGKYGYVCMRERYKGLQLPRITMIDLNRQYHRKEMYGHFSDPLAERIQEELQKHKQVILFQNRRGYAPYMQCEGCGSVPKCPSCDVPLTLHRNREGSYMQCHYCGQQSAIPAACPECRGVMKIHGFGTERLEEEVAHFFPMARVERLDLDSTRKKDAYQQIITRFAQHNIDILIGTQMVTKGLHFDDVSLVAVLNADSLFNQPSFRSYERGYQMLEQVAGRAGRKDRQGEVIIQTFDPTHPIFAFLKKHDTDGFYDWQIKEREQFRFPPFTRLCTITVKHTDETKIETGAQYLQGLLSQAFGKRCSQVILPSITRMQNYFVRQVQLRIENAAPLPQARQLIWQAVNNLLSSPQGKTIQVIIDMDPM